MPIFVLAHVLLAYLFPLYLARDSPNVAIDGHPIYLAAVFPIASCGLLGYVCSETKRIGDIFDLLCKGAVLLDYFIAVPACIAVSIKQTGKQFQSVVFAVGYVFLWDVLVVNKIVLAENIHYGIRMPFGFCKSECSRLSLDPIKGKP